MKIFVIHSRNQREEMMRLISKLRGFYLDDVISYDTDVPVGEDWVESILNEIRKSDIVLFLVSTDSIESQSCHLELRVALSQLIPVLPVLFHQVKMRYWESLPKDIGSKLTIRPLDFREGLDGEGNVGSIDGFEELRAEIDRFKTVTLTASTITAQANILAAEHRFREALMLLERRSSVSQEALERIKNLILREQAKHELSKLFDIPVTQTYITFQDDMLRWLNQLGGSTDKEFTSWVDTANEVTLDRAYYEEFQHTEAIVSRMGDQDRRAIALVENRLKQQPDNRFLINFLAELRLSIRYTLKELKREIDLINDQINGEKSLDLNNLILYVDTLSENYAHLGQNREVMLLLEKLDSIKQRAENTKVIENEVREQVLRLMEQLENGEIATDKAEAILRTIDSRNPGFRERYPEYKAAINWIYEYQSFKIDFDELSIRLKQQSFIKDIDLLEKDVLQLENSRFYTNLPEDDKKQFREITHRLSILKAKTPYIEAIYRSIENEELIDSLELYKTHLIDIDASSSSIFEDLRAKLSERLTAQVNREIEAIRKAYADNQSDDGDAMVQEMLVKYDKLVR